MFNYVTLKELYRTIRRYYRDYKKSYNLKIKLFNYQWPTNNVKDHWLYRFIEHKGYLDRHPKKTISIFGINGDRLAININKSNYKIFYTIENVHVKTSFWEKYEDLLLNHDSINLSLGFDYLKHEKYLRFPYWLMTTFEPEFNYSQIKKVCEDINNYQVNERPKFCSFICRKDYFNERKIIYDLIREIEYIHCPSQFMHNDDELKIKFANNKLEYLKQFKFNLCPENTNFNGYVTEKIFDAIISGCIPIYWGSNNNPEPEIINHKAVLFFDMYNNNESLLKEITTLNSNYKKYKLFVKQQKFLSNAPDVIFEYFVKLDKKLREIIR